MMLLIMRGRYLNKWAELDLNQRRHSQRIYNPPPLTTRAPTLSPLEDIISHLKRQYRTKES